MNEWPFTDAAPTASPWLALDGLPISGDAIREITYDSHPTHPFRMPELLWAAVCK